MDTEIDRRFKRAWSFFTSNAAELVLGTLVVCLGSMLVIPGPWLTLNLLGEVADSIEAGRTVRWRATYERTSTFLPAWGLALTAGLAISFGLALCVIPGALLMVAWFHAPRFVAQGRPVFQALGDSHRLLRRSDDWVATLLNGLVLVAFAVAMGFSAVLTAVVLPLGMAYLALCTQDTVHGGTDPVTTVDRPLDATA